MLCINVNRQNHGEQLLEERVVENVSTGMLFDSYREKVGARYAICEVTQTIRPIRNIGLLPMISAHLPHNKRCGG